MREATNLSWPETPFGAVQRPYGTHVPLLAALGLAWADGLPAAAAFTYLRLHRTRPIIVATDTLTFGFYAAASETGDETAALIGGIDHLLVQARRQASVLAGHDLHRDLTRLQTAAGTPTRGISALLPVWASAKPGRGIAGFVDTSTRPDGTIRPLAEVRAAYRIAPGGPSIAESASDPSDGAGAGGSTRAQDRLLATTSRSLLIAVAAAAINGTHTWEQPLDLDAALAREAWDQLPIPPTADPSTAAGRAPEHHPQPQRQTEPR